MRMTFDLDSFVTKKQRRKKRSERRKKKSSSKLQTGDHVKMKKWRLECTVPS